MSIAIRPERNFFLLATQKRKNFTLHCRNLYVWKLTRSKVHADYRNNETNSQKNTPISLSPFLLFALCLGRNTGLRSEESKRLPFREQQQKSKQVLS